MMMALVPETGDRAKPLRRRDDDQSGSGWRMVVEVTASKEAAEAGSGEKGSEKEGASDEVGCDAAE